MRATLDPKICNDDRTKKVIAAAPVQIESIEKCDMQAKTWGEVPGKKVAPESSYSCDLDLTPYRIGPAFVAFAEGLHQSLHL